MEPTSPVIQEASQPPVGSSPPPADAAHVVDSLADSSFTTRQPEGDSQDSCYARLDSLATCLLNGLYDLLSWIHIYPNRTAEVRAVVQFLQRFSKEACEEMEDCRTPFFEGFLRLPTSAQIAARRLLFDTEWNRVRQSDEERPGREHEERKGVAAPRRSLQPSPQEIVQTLNNYIHNDHFNRTVREALERFAGIYIEGEE